MIIFERQGKTYKIDYSTVPTSYSGPDAWLEKLMKKGVPKQVYNPNIKKFEWVDLDDGELAAMLYLQTIRDVNILQVGDVIEKVPDGALG